MRKTDGDKVRQALVETAKWTEAQWYASGGMGVNVSCNHPDCRNTKTIDCVSPIQMRYALKSMQCEVFYCHVHRSVAWEKFGVISDYLLPYLKRVQKLGACNKSKSRLKQGSIDFLTGIGLLSLVPVQRGANVVYQIKIADDGERHLAKNAAQLDLYMSHQVRDSQLEWNWVPSNTAWPDGTVA